MKKFDTEPTSGAVWSLSYAHSYSHLYLLDRDSDEVLSHIVGDERYVSGLSALLLFVRPDTEGDVYLEFFFDEIPAAVANASYPIFDGMLDFPSGVIQLATVGAADDEDQLELPQPGAWHLQASGIGQPRPKYLAILLSKPA